MKKMRMLSMLLALLLVFSLSLSVLADDAAKITVESWTEDANAGDEVTLAVSVENNPGFLSAVWEIGYDSSKLALQSINTAYNVESEGKTREITYLSGIYAPNPKKNIVTFMNTTLVKDNGTIFTLTFLVKDGANFGEAAVSVTAKELFAEEGKKVTAVSVPGGVTIAESTGGSTTGGSTTGGSTTGGSTTGGSTTGGSTTGGSTTGGSTTGGSTTGGSTTGGSTTGGSTTGGSTTGGSTTGSEHKVELVGKSNGATYKITGNTLNVQNDAACVVLWTDDGGETYTKIAATKNEAGGYDFDLTNVPANAVIKIAIKGDANGDGELDAADAAMIRAAEVGLGAGLTKLQEYIADINGDGEVDSADAALARSVEVGNTTLSW